MRFAVCGDNERSGSLPVPLHVQLPAEGAGLAVSEGGNVLPTGGGIEPALVRFVFRVRFHLCRSDFSGFIGDQHDVSSRGPVRRIMGRRRHQHDVLRDGVGHRLAQLFRKIETGSRGIGIDRRMFLGGGRLVRDTVNLGAHAAGLRGADCRDDAALI